MDLLYTGTGMNSDATRAARTLSNDQSVRASRATVNSQTRWNGNIEPRILTMIASNV